ncbi:hypothetical protein A2955_02355 [Candidatus Woesebacteria bacterium RIFCSPLOWO2_01_FULL_37_19]|uniref:O-antigen ligase-related domain-containing protein n=2 Tax=Candidatus Woeseibacteriota TaxID=1752722 RepID=A0A1F8AZB6_9BACT|nr:MAG: hypothetical protein A2771_01525 [Candidatus Woesebacteria bacterium RIFCSPHIGHO2_01_FULL_38_26b]OGM56575.1 MAG: hypothetical protein A2955_02355 [Candidatus Woesebacteria bacterium RIFCSPLOWO2_01_FULL_37_19]
MFKKRGIFNSLMTFSRLLRAGFSLLKKDDILASLKLWRSGSGSIHPRTNARGFLETVIKYTTAAILLGVPLYPKFPLIRIPATFVSIRLEDILIAFSAILLLGAYLPIVKKIFNSGLKRSVLLYISVGFVSLISAIFITKTIIPHIGLLHWLRRIEYIIPLFLGIEAVKRDRNNLDYFFKLLLITIFLSFIYGLGQRYFQWPIIITQNEEYSKGVALRWVQGSHINSTFAGHYDLASFLVLVLPVVVATFFTLSHSKSKIILALTYFSGMWLLVNSASRISLVSYLIATIFALAFIKKYKAILLVVLVSLLFISFSSNLISRYQRIIDVSINRIKSVKLMFNISNNVLATNEEIIFPRQRLPLTPTPQPVFEDRSTNIRLNVEWPRALRAFAKNPLLGTGYSSITLATDNDYLRLLGEVGLMGFLAFFLLILRILLIFIKKYPFDKHFKGLELSYIAGIFGSFAGVFTNAVFIDVFEASKFAIVFWLLMGFSISILSKNESFNN